MNRFESLSGKALLFLSFIWLLWFLNFTGRTIFSPILPLLEDEFHVSHAKASSIAALISIGYACSVFFSGIFSRLFGAKKAIVISLMVTACIYLCLPFVKNFNTIYFFGFFLGLTTGMYIPNIIPIITEYYEERVWGRVISIHDSAASMSIFGAPFVALFFLSFVSWRTMFALLAIAYIVCGVVFALKVEGLKTEGKKKFIQADLLKNKALWLTGIIWIFAAGANLGLYFIIPLYLTKELGVPIAQANATFGFSRLGGVIVSIAAGFFADRFSLKKTTIVLLIATGILTILVAIGDVRWIRLILFLQASIATGFFPISLVTISKMFSREERGQATGFVLAFGSVFGIGIVPYLLGISGDLVSFRVGILALGILTALSSLLVIPLRDSPQMTRKGRAPETSATRR
ncbi:MAG TPA: MFS transporter [Syntrophorhabdaceae bacterium]